MTLPLTLAGQTDVGQRRRDNQDTFISKPLWSDSDALLAAIDGVGGYAGGDRAAQIARDAIEAYMAKPTGDTLTMLREAVVYANNQIVEQRRQEPNLARMCCVLTVTVADVKAQRILFAHVGDTRMYRFREGELYKLTHDHSIVGVREDAGQLNEREAMNHPRRNEILRDVGSTPHRVDDPDFLESGETEFLPGDTLLLCSDGLTDMLNRAQIAEVLEQEISIDEQVDELIRRANEQGGHDNITVVMARFPARADDVKTTAAPGEPTVSTPVAAPKSPTAETSATPIASPGSTRRTIIGLGFVLMGLFLAGLAWWSRESTETPKPVVSPPVILQPDSSAVQSDSLTLLSPAVPTDSVSIP